MEVRRCRVYCYYYYLRYRKRQNARSILAERDSYVLLVLYRVGTFIVFIHLAARDRCVLYSRTLH